jgi:TolB-like protein
MGEVYRARDPRLGRDVALKVLPAATAGDPVALERFTREAQALAALNHPHIVTIHSNEEAGGVRFLTMELVEGRPLDSAIPNGGVSLAQFFEVSMAMADALAAAHEKQILHRDLKPGNVMLTDSGRVKVLDFGLARARDVVASGSGDEATRAALTGEGTILGTTAYMSPEQIEGKALDGRSDLFALGIVMYELLTGERPFRGDSSPAVMAAVMKDRPKHVGEVRHDAPAALSRLVDRCLEKDARNRPESAQEVLLELKALKTAWESGSVAAARPVAPPARRRVWSWRRSAAVGAAVVVLAGLPAGWFAMKRRSGAPQEKPTVAVLPFADLSEAKDQTYFSDGVSEDILNVLSKIPELRVTSRSSAFSFKGKDVEVTEIARRLNVGHILEGSVRKAGNSVRITATLIDAKADRQVWTETYERTLDDVLAVQDEIAYAVARQLRRTLAGSEPRPRKVDGRAYDLFLQAVDVTRQARPDRYEQTQRILKEVLAIDPNFVDAWEMLGNSYLSEANQGMSDRPPAELIDLARQAADRAVAIDPNDGWSCALQASVALAVNDPQSAARYLERAFALAPNDTNMLVPAAVFLQRLGRINESVALREYALTFDPLNPYMQFNLGSAYFLAQRYDDAIAAGRRSLAISPKRTVAHYNIGAAMLMKHDAAGALAEFQQEPSDVWKAIGLPMALHASGREKEANAALETLIARDKEGSSFNIAEVYALRGEPNKAFEWLDNAVTYHDTGLPLVPIDPLLESLHRDPRWTPFLRKIGRAPDQLAAVKFDIRIPGE